MNIRESFERVGFTPEEKMDLTARLERAAELEENMTNATKRKIKKISGGMIFGVAAAAVMTVGALAAVLNPGLRTWFGGQEALESSIYCLDRSETYKDWTVTLAECIGDDYSAYIWVDITSPKGTALTPAGFEYLKVTYQMEDLKGETLIEGMSLEKVSDADSTDNKISYILEYSWTGESLQGKTVNIKINPLCEFWYDEPAEAGGLIDPIRDHQWVFEDVTLDFPDQTIRLRPNVEVPWLDGTVTVTRLDISPLSLRADVEGGACATYEERSTPTPQVPAEPDETVTAKDGTTIELYNGATIREGGEAGINEASLTIGDETFVVCPNDGYYKVIYASGMVYQSKDPADEESYALFKRSQEMLKAFKMETVLKDGTSLTAQATVYDNAGTREGAEGPETLYRVFARRYSKANDGPAGSVDIAQVDHVSICGVDIPVDPAASIPVEQFAEAPVSQPAVPDSPEPPEGKDPVLGTVTAGKGLNVRSGPGTRYQVMNVLKKGEQVTILGEENGFYQVHCADGQIGYVSKNYVSVK